ncbi:hypothetical protein PFISCL1PPCAC_26181, partial [Pristionchus fissidentatus]
HDRYFGAMVGLLTTALICSLLLAGSLWGSGALRGIWEQVAGVLVIAWVLLLLCLMSPLWRRKGK